MHKTSQMKSVKNATLAESKPLKKLPVSAATAVPKKHKIQKNQRIVTSSTTGNDERLQSPDTRRRYMRRGSKTPAMLLIEASRDLDTLGKSLFPVLGEKYSDLRNTSYHALNSKALAMATAVDSSSDSYLINCRIRRKSNSWTADEINALHNASPDVVPTYRGENSLTKLSSMSYEQPRRLSAMTALKEYLDTASISYSPNTKS